MSRPISSTFTCVGAIARPIRRRWGFGAMLRIHHDRFRQARAAGSARDLAPDLWLAADVLVEVVPAPPILCRAIFGGTPNNPPGRLG